jgi:hypothetical protein
MVEWRKGWKKVESSMYRRERLCSELSEVVEGADLS